MIHPFYKELVGILPKGVGPRDLGRHPLTIAGKTVLTVEVREDGLTEVVKYEILD